MITDPRVDELLGLADTYASLHADAREAQLDGLLSDVVFHAAAKAAKERLEAALTQAIGVALPVLAYDAGDNISIEQARQKNGRILWAIRSNIGGVLGVNGLWVYEPQPSERDDAFIAEHRFNNPQEAGLALQKERGKAA